MPSRRYLIVALLGAAGTLALVAADRPVAIQPIYTCVMPEVSHERRRDPVIEAMLISRPDAVAGCGHFLIETPMVFADVRLAVAQYRFRVLVPCAEMPRTMYSSTAGDAPVLAVGETYRLALEPVAGDIPWRAVRIDIVPVAQPGGLPVSPAR